MNDIVATMSSLVLLKTINEARMACGEPEMANSKFLLKVEDELDDLSERKSESLGGRPANYYDLTRDQCMLVAMRESKGVRRSVLEKLKDLEQQVDKPKLPQTYLEALKELVAVTEVAEQQAKKIEQDKPLVTFAETVTNSTDCIAVGDLAKVVSDQNIKIGRNKLFQWLRDNEYLMSDNKPYQKYVDQGLFNLIEQTYKTPYGDKISFKTLVTGKGQITIVEKLREIFGEN